MGIILREIIGGGGAASQISRKDHFILRIICCGQFFTLQLDIAAIASSFPCKHSGEIGLAILLILFEIEVLLLSKACVEICREYLFRDDIISEAFAGEYCLLPGKRGLQNSFLIKCLRVAARRKRNAIEHGVDFAWFRHKEAGGTLQKRRFVIQGNRQCFPAQRIRT